MLVVGLVAGCSRGETVGPATQPTGSAADPGVRVVAAVGPSPRIYATGDPREPGFRDQLALIAAVAANNGGGSLAACGVALDSVERIRMAIGEPLRVAAELDGALDTRRVAYVLGDSLMTRLREAGITFRDRPGGVTVERGVQQVVPAAPARAAVELLSQCVGRSCAVALLGAPGHELWIELRYGAMLGLRIHGPEFHGAAAIASAIETTLTSRGLRVPAARDLGGTLEIEIPQSGPDVESLIVPAAVAIRQDVLGAFSIPSTSMVPTLLQGDHIYVAKTSWRGPLAAGDLLVYREPQGRDFVQRLIAHGGQTVTVTPSGIEIDGVAVPNEVVDPAFVFDGVDDSGVTHKFHGVLVREHLRDRSYLVIHTRPVQAGSWTVPAGELFFLGDNRENSYDSRFAGTISEADIRGRVVGLWYAARDGLPDWTRIGSSPQ